MANLALPFLTMQISKKLFEKAEKGDLKNDEKQCIKKIEQNYNFLMKRTAKADQNTILKASQGLARLMNIGIEIIQNGYEFEEVLKDLELTYLNKIEND